MAKTVLTRPAWTGLRSQPFRLTGQTFQATVFDALGVRHAVVEDCGFERCEFRNSGLGHHAVYRRCTWRGCRFHGQYGGLGPDARYEDCTFENTRLEGLDALFGVELRRCRCSGRWRNLIIDGQHSPTVDNRSRLVELDLRDCTFDNVAIQCGVDLSTVKLPRQSIRVFRNPDQAFALALEQRAAQLGKTAVGIPLFVFGTGARDQDPVVLDEANLAHLLDKDGARPEFEALARPFEIAPATWNP